MSMVYCLNHRTNVRGLDSRFFRFAVKRRNENERLIAALGDILLSESD